MTKKRSLLAWQSAKKEPLTDCCSVAAAAESVYLSCKNLLQCDLATNAFFCGDSSAQAKPNNGYIYKDKFMHNTLAVHLRF